MLRNTEPWWRRLFAVSPVPAYVAVRPPEARHCPDCYAAYTPRDRYCPDCHTTVPEWRFG